jgi:branched-chain amino acid transport system substrate-binding protein
MKNYKLGLLSACFGLGMAFASNAVAEPVKIGMITTLSGGGAGLGCKTVRQ